jgi:O-antigen ligase
MVTGILVGGSLFLAGRLRERAILLALLPLIVNALIATISRSGFLAICVGGILFNYFTPPAFRKQVRIFSVLAAVLFAVLANSGYWSRIESIKHQREEVEGVDTGSGRLVLIKAQWRMFQEHPFGCGHMCTTVLSDQYLDDSYLLEGARASHNTFMSVLEG